jgi:hypothetical protein
VETLSWDWYTPVDVLRAEQEQVFRRVWPYPGPAAWVSGKAVSAQTL